jgi:hypothetical protein
MRFDTVAAGVMSSFSMAGTFIRVACSAVLLAVLGVIAIGFASLYGGSSFRSTAPKPVDARPAFRISAGEFAGKAATGHVVTSSRLGRAEVVQYGQLNNRGSDLAIVLVMPPKGIGMGTQFVQDLADINLLRPRRPITCRGRITTSTRASANTAPPKCASTPMAAGSTASPSAAGSKPRRSI